MEKTMESSPMFCVTRCSAKVKRLPSVFHHNNVRNESQTNEAWIVSFTEL